MADLPAPRPTKDARRALVLQDRPLVADLIELTLNHGLFVVRTVRDIDEADAALAGWAPHIAIVDMDHDDSTTLLQRLGASHTLKPSVTPVLGLTRRGDLPTKLRAFELGVDDIVTTPFSPEELLARAVVIVRRASGIDRPIVPDDHDRRGRDRHPPSRGQDRDVGHPPERDRTESAVRARQPAPARW